MIRRDSRSRQNTFINSGRKRDDTPSQLGKQGRPPYEKLLYSPMKQPIIINQTQQLVRVDSKYALSALRSQSKSIDIPAILYLVDLLSAKKSLQRTSKLQIIELITWTILKEEDSPQFDRLKANHIRRFILNLRDPFAGNTIKYDQIIAIYFVKLIKHHNPPLSDQQDPKVEDQDQKPKHKLTFYDLEPCYHYLIQKGFYTDWILAQYLDQMNRIPEIQSDIQNTDPKHFVDLFFALQNRLNGLFNYQKLFPDKQKSSKQISRDLYRQYINKYIQLLNNDQIYYFVNSQLQDRPLFVTQFLYEDEFVPIMKNVYAKLFQRLFDPHSDSYGLLIHNTLYERALEVIIQYFSPGFPQDKELIHLILRNFQKLLLQKNSECKKWSFTIFKLAKLYMYESKIFHKEMFKGLKKQIWLYEQLLGRSISKITPDIFDAVENALFWFWSGSQNKNVQLNTQSQAKKLKNLCKSNFQRLIVLIRNQCRNNFFKCLLSHFNMYQDNIENHIFHRNNEKALQIKRIFDINRQKIESKVIQESIISPPPQQMQVSKWYIYSSQVGIVRLNNLISFTKNYLKLFPNSRKQAEAIRHIIQEPMFIEQVEMNICYPNLVRNLMELIHVLKERIEFFDISSQPNGKQLIRIIQEARNRFSSQLSEMAKPGYKIPAKYPTYYNPLLPLLKIAPISCVQSMNFDFSLKKQNIQQNLLHDISLQLLQVESKLKRQIGQQLLKLDFLKVEKATVVKNYIDFPYYADYLIEMNEKNIVIMAITSEDSIELTEESKKSMEYFEQMKFTVLAATTTAEVSDYLHNIQVNRK